MYPTHDRKFYKLHPPLDQLSNLTLSAALALQQTRGLIAAAVARNSRYAPAAEPDSQSSDPDSLMSNELKNPTVPDMPGNSANSDASDPVGQPFAEYEVYRICPHRSSANMNMLYDVQEEAARRLALRLHDESAQLLATVYLQLADIARECPDAVVRKIDRVVSQLDDVCEQLRRLSHETRPLILDQLGLVPALQFLAGGVRKRSGLAIVVSGQVPTPLPAVVKTVLYRVVQEALTNVVRHAGATEVAVRVDDVDGQVTCRIRDNGIGFKPSEDNQAEVHGLGLVGIQERVEALGGSCRILSSWGNGTELQVEIPL